MYSYTYTKDLVAICIMFRLHRGEQSVPRNHTHRVSESHVTNHVIFSNHPPTEGSTSASSESCDEHRTPSPEAITSSPVSRQPRVTCDEGRGEPRETGDKGRRCQKRRGDKKKLPERKSDRVIWDGNGRRRQKKEAMVDEKTDRDVKDGRVGTRQSVQVVREGNQGGGGGGEIEKVSSIQQDHLKKTQLLQDTQKQQDDSQKNTQLKVSNTHSFTLVLWMFCGASWCRGSWRRSAREEQKPRKQLLDLWNTSGLFRPSWRRVHGRESWLSLEPRNRRES